MQQWLTTLVAIILLNLVLSGDNAMVIGMACRDLPRQHRRRAMVFGGAAAIVLRIIFAAAAVWLLKVPLLQAVGGLFLLWVAWKLVTEAKEENRHHSPSETVWAAVRTIALADLALSLDNVLSIAGVADGNLLALAVGVALSIPIILSGSSLIAWLLRRHTWLLWVGGAVLTWTAGHMVVKDAVLGPRLPVPGTVAAWLLPLVLTVALLVPAFVSVRRRPTAAPLHEPENG